MSRIDLLDRRRSRWRIYLHLGRVSNLPTVWTNSLAGIKLSGGGLDQVTLVLLLSALSLFYTGGMFLNDAFDYQWDQVSRPERPIPAKEISLREVFTAGFSMLILGEGLLALPALLQAKLPNLEVMSWGLILGSIIIYYNYRHKKDPLSPLVMALCRAMVYLISAAAVASALIAQVLTGAGILAAYVVGLTHVAKQESLKELKNFWPLACLLAPFIYTFVLLPRRDVYSLIYLLFLAWVIYAISLLLRKRGRDIGGTAVKLIAGISLVDAVLIGTGSGQVAWGGAALAGFLLTLVFQRYIPGT